MARFYLDEHIHRDVGEMLTQYGHDAVHAYYVGHHSTPDTDHLLFAADSGRILVTLNRKDFEALHRLWIALNTWVGMDREHAGILTTWGQISPAEWAGPMHFFLGQRPRMNNQMWEWNRQQRSWKTYGW